MKPSFRKRLQAGDRLLGTMVTLNEPAVAEILGGLGFDWLFIDGEHGALDTADLAGMMQAAGEVTACIVRVPATEEGVIKRTLDAGADGIIVPQVNTAKQAEAVVRFSRYAPLGSRGVGLGRAHGYGLRFAEYVETANERVTVIAQAEHAEAVENIEAIVQVEGIDAILLGPYDLAASLGKMGQVDDPVVVEAIGRVTQVTQAAGLPLGMFGVNAAAVRQYAEQGYQLLVAGVDTMHLAGAANQALEELRGL